MLLPYGTVTIEQQGESLVRQLDTKGLIATRPAGI